MRKIQKIRRGLLVVGLVSCSLNGAAFAHPQEAEIALSADDSTSVQEPAPTAEQLRRWNAPIKGWHPIKRLMRPVWKLRRNAIEIEQKLQSIEVPVRQLQPSLLSIDEKIADANGNMNEMQEKLAGLNGNIPTLNNNITVFQAHMDQLGRGVREVVGVKKELHDVIQIRQEMRQLDAHIAGLKQPLQQINKPVSNISTPLATMSTELRGLNDNVAATSSELNQVVSEVSEMRAEMKEMKIAMQQLKQPVNSISSPVIAVHNDLKELNEVLLIALRTILLTGLAAIAATFALLLKFRERLAKMASRLSFGL